MPTRKIKLLVTVATVLVATLIGAQAGYVLGRGLAMRLADEKLRQFAAQTITEADAASLESRAMLAAMKSSQDPFCSDQEIATFRNLIFLSEYLKEAGRIRDGKIVCSAMLGRLSDPVALPKPDFTQSDGIQIYTRLAPFQVGDLSVVSLQQDDSYIIFSPYIEASQASAPTHYTVMAIHDPGQPLNSSLGALLPARSSIFSGEPPSQLDSGIHTTLCSERYSNCVTEYMLLPDLLSAGRNEVAGGAALGGLLGAALGWFCSRIYGRRRTMEKQLRRAIARRRLRMVYQPIVNPTSGCALGAEALSRWTNEQGDAIEPEVFVKLAEEKGFAVTLTRFVLHQVLSDMAPILKAHPGFRISINITPDDLADPNFLPMVVKALRKADLPAQSLAFEVTEAATTQTAGAPETIRQMRLHGHSVFIDDFGSRYSSLTSLNLVPVDAIKIDREFTKAIGIDAPTTVMLPQILAMARALNLQVIVEGIETAQQIVHFSTSGMPILAQGWFFGRPVPAIVFKEWLAEDEKRPLPAAAHAA